MGTVSELLGLAGAKSTPDASPLVPEPKSTDHSASGEEIAFADRGARMGEENEALRNLLIDASHQLRAIDDLRKPPVSWSSRSPIF